MRSQLLGSRGAVRNGHRERSDAPVRNAQAHAWQQRTRGAAEEGPRAAEGGRVCPKEYRKTFSFLHREIHTRAFFLSPASRSLRNPTEEEVGKKPEGTRM